MKSKMKTKEQTLYLTLKKKRFDIIASEIQDEEYRDIKKRWAKRFLKKSGYANIKEFYSVKFRNGYAKKAPVIEFKVKSITIGQGKVEWGAPSNKDVFIIKLGERIYEN